jgi:hypothetical protein
MSEREKQMKKMVLGWMGRIYAFTHIPIYILRSTVSGQIVYKRCVVFPFIKDFYKE